MLIVLFRDLPFAISVCVSRGSCSGDRDPSGVVLSPGGNEQAICEQRAPPPFYTLSSSLRGLLCPTAHTATDKDYITFINPAELRSEDHIYCQRLRRLRARRGDPHGESAVLVIPCR